MKVLFVHNTITNYRIPFFYGMNKKIDVDFLFIHKNLGEKIYGDDIKVSDKENMNIKFLPENIKKYKEIIKCINQENYSKIILPPIDTFQDYIICLFIFCVSKRDNIKLFYFGEKWEAPKNKQPLKKKVKNYLQKLAIMSITRNIDKCIVSGTKSKEYFTSLGIKNENIKIAIDASEVYSDKKLYDIKKENMINRKAKIVLYYGRIIERKGLDILIKAYKELESKDNNLFLLICGDGDDFKDHCVKLCRDLKVQNFLFKGYVNPEERFKYFSQSSVFVLPSYFYKGTCEAWGLTVNESLQCGTPVISTEAVGAAYDLLNGINGKMIKENSVIDLVNALEEFLYKKSDIDVKNECIKVYRKFNYENMVNSFIKAIKI